MLKKIQNPVLRNIAEWAAAFAVALLVFFLFTNFITRTAVIFGESMDPTLADGDRVLINRVTYIFVKPKYGDIIAFPYHSDPSRHFVKRVIGLPGDVIDCIDDNLLINGSPYSDSFAENGLGSWNIRGDIRYPFTVPDGSYFVLGDYRNRSEDSRYNNVGCVPRKEIDGKVIFRVGPFSKFGLIR
jgi:signal peptidase I